MNIFWSLLVAAVLYGFLYYVRQPGRGGVIGQKIRDSDHAAWRDAVEKKEQELLELRSAEPRVRSDRKGQR